MPVQRFAQVFGAVYLLVGLLGFAFTGFGGFAASAALGLAGAATRWRRQPDGRGGRAGRGVPPEPLLRRAGRLPGPGDEASRPSGRPRRP
jgi:hypothetical protein